MCTLYLDYIRIKVNKFNDFDIVDVEEAPTNDK